MSEHGIIHETLPTLYSDLVSGDQNEYTRNGAWPRMVIYRLAMKRANVRDLLGLFQNSSISREIVSV